MADTPDLGSGAERYAGSTPAPSTCDLIEVTHGQGDTGQREILSLITPTLIGGLFVWATFKVHSVAGVLRRGVLTTLANVPTCQLGP